MTKNPYLNTKQTYPLAVVKKMAETLIANGVDVVDLTVGDPFGATADVARDALVQSVHQTPFSQYPKSSGSFRYLQAVSEWAEREYGVVFDPETEILSSNGSKEAVFHFPMCFDWSDGQMSVAGDLSYPVYRSSSSILGYHHEQLSVDLNSGFLVDLEAVPDAVWQKCQIFWINSPHNPTTAIASYGYLKRLLELAEMHDFIVCSDECYNDLYFSDKPTSCLQFQDSDRWIVFRSLSKRSHMTGYRCGAVISKNKELIADFKRLRLPMGLGTPTFIQEAGIAALDDEGHAEDNKVFYQQRRDLLKPLLEKAGCRVFGGEAGFYFWLDHPNYSTSDELAKRFLNAGLVVTPGTVFGDSGEGYIRLVTCFKENQLEKVISCLEKLS